MENTSGKFDLFWEKWPFRQRKQAAIQMWLSVVSREDEHKVFACLERFLASDQASRSIFGYADNWLANQHRDHWQGDWPPAAQQAPSKSRLEKMMEQV